MNLKQLLQHFTLQLQHIYDAEELSSIFYVATSHISGWNRADVMLKGQEPLSGATEAVYLHLLEGLKRGEPIQYVMGETVFYGLPFKVNPSVLIPRPETEELVDWIITDSALAAATGAKLRIMDIGTGSGCIAISLKKHIAGARVTALDVSEPALETASSNATLNKAIIEFVKADIRQFSTTDKFDLIVSNPPYIRQLEKKDMHDHVLNHEPHLALFVADEHALVFYEAIADFAWATLSDMGFLYFEINEHLSKETIEMLSAKAFKNIELKKDMQGKDRMIRCMPGRI